MTARVMSLVLACAVAASSAGAAANQASTRRTGTAPAADRQTLIARADAAIGAGNHAEAERLLADAGERFSSVQALLKLARLRAAQGEAHALVQRRGGGIELGRGIPEVAHQLHLPRVIPDVRADRTAGGGDPCQLAECGAPVRNEVEDQPRDGDVDGPVLEREVGGRAAVEPCPPGELGLRLLAKPVRRLDADQGRGVTPVQDRRAQRSRAASDIQPSPAGRNVQPRQEAWRDPAAPASDVLLVGVASLPGVRDRRRCHGGLGF